MKTQLTIAILLCGATAMADDPKKAPDMKKAPEPAKKDDTAAKKDAPKDAPKKAEMPKPPKELEDMAKSMSGTWKCTGKGAMDPADMTKMSDITGTMTAKLDMDKWWVRGDWTGKSNGMTMKGTMFTTYDPTAKKWTRVMIDNGGGAEWATSTGMTGTKMVWEGEMHGMGMTAKTRSTEDITAKEVKITSEGSMDGKKYATVFEMSCKK